MKPVICFTCQADITTHKYWFFHGRNIYCTLHKPAGSTVFGTK